eukprot:3660389-Pyramimonas_sp.AAC.1
MGIRQRHDRHTTGNPHGHRMEPHQRHGVGQTATRWPAPGVDSTQQHGRGIQAGMGAHGHPW